MKYFLPVWEDMALDRVFSNLQTAIDWVKQLEGAPLIKEDQEPEHPGHTSIRWWGTFGRGEELSTHYHITEVIVVN